MSRSGKKLPTFEFERQNISGSCKQTFHFKLGAIFILRKDIGVGGRENGNFPLLYVVKMSLRRWVGGSKKPQNTLT